MATKQKRGRKDIYQLKIEPRFEEIAKWKKEGLIERDIAKNLGISYSTFNKYKAEKKEFSDLLLISAKPLVTELKGALVRKALGFKYIEKKKYTKTDKNGEILSEYVEEVEKYQSPDVAAIHLLLKNLDRNQDGSSNWSNDWNNERRKDKELELKEKQINSNIWE